jgi:hypothetical protein
MEQHKLTISQYFNVLGLEPDSTVDEIRKAYRRKARECHPDINPNPDATETFLSVTEAYEFLLIYSEKISRDEEAFKKAMEDWRKYRQDRSKYRANVYARTTYSGFKDTNFYKSTRIFDGATIILCLAFSLIVLLVTVLGYIYRIHHPLPDIENPSVSIFITFILFSMVLFVISFVYLKAYIQSSKKYKNLK